jgi:hypothetical protein
VEFFDPELEFDREAYPLGVSLGRVGATLHHVIIVSQNTVQLMTASIVHVTGSIDDSRYGVHVTNLTPPGSECSPTSGPGQPAGGRDDAKAGVHGVHARALLRAHAQGAAHPVLPLAARAAAGGAGKGWHFSRYFAVKTRSIDFDSRYGPCKLSDTRE